MAQLRLRPFEPDDLAGVVCLWNRCLAKDPITEERFWQLFLLDPNFDCEGALVAESGGEIAGFLQAITRRHPQDSRRQGCVTIFFVDPGLRRRGIGTSLLNRGLEYLKASGCERAACNGYSPYYILPGVDVDYQEACAFLSGCGFLVASEPVAMGRSLERFSAPEDIRRRNEALRAEGFDARPFDRRDTLPLLAFAGEHFPEWRMSVLDSLQHGNREITLGTLRNEIVGFAQWENTYTDPPAGAPGRFGPFGVRADLRSRGIGAMIFYSLMERVAAAGARCLWFGWAGGRNLSFYERAGCEVTRRYRLFTREI